MMAHKISFLIPCTVPHFQNISKPLQFISKLTKKPDEIIISVSEGTNLQQKLVKDIEQTYNVKVLIHDEKLTHGPNRQKLVEEASGDLLIFQDADDYAHPQRVEVIDHFFNTYDIVHLNHTWTPMGINHDTLVIDEIPHIKSSDIYKACFPNKALVCNVNSYGEGLHFKKVTAGSVALTKDAANSVNWKRWKDVTMRAEDLQYCLELLFKFNKSMLIDAPLITYTNVDYQVGGIHETPQ